MIGWLSLTDNQRRATLQEASIRSGISTKALEKDWWVTLSLKALFSIEYAPFFIFKGGTSLSKGWKLIKRFSEDIDIALNPAAFNMAYHEMPSHSYVKKLKRSGCKFTTEKITPALKAAFTNLGVNTNAFSIEAEAMPPTLPDKDPQIVYVRYTSLFEPHPYLTDQVKIEFSVRSLQNPYAAVQIESLLNEFFPNQLYPENPFTVLAVEPRKTLMEKAFLLHEKLHLGSQAVLKYDRQSRHLYDLVQLMDTEAGKAAVLDSDLYATLVKHREHYIRMNGVNYQQLVAKYLSFVPTVNHLDDLRLDYEAMQEAMIYGASPNFQELITQLKILNARFQLMGTGVLLEKLIDAAVQKGNLPGPLAISRIVHVPVEVANEAGLLFRCEVTLVQLRSTVRFEFLRFE